MGGPSVTVVEHLLTVGKRGRVVETTMDGEEPRAAYALVGRTPHLVLPDVQHAVLARYSGESYSDLRVLSTVRSAREVKRKGLTGDAWTYPPPS
jgi:hypothetical protein